MSSPSTYESDGAWDLTIAPGHAERHYWRDLWRFRELFYILSWRDIKVRYKQTVLGVAWSVLRPLLTTLVFTLVFSRMAGLRSGSAAPYALMVFAGMLPWQFFSNALSESSNSLIGNANLITKVYFPRLIIPASAVITSMVDFLISFVLLLLMMAYFRFTPSWHMVFLPVFIMMVFCCAFGAGLLLTALNVRYRDFRYIIPFIIQFGLYITPVGFNSALIPETWRGLYALNPMVGVVEGFRWCLLGEAWHSQSIIISAVVSLLLPVMGIWYFRRTEKSFADII